eukprot:TRINITY_DN6747_c0_g1_i2.p1 TRINITY_DN6747_c0_g1~~TRINITY_DN6747_c0_g1_i2.p1  ORF type:complete len:1464 (-),score=382.31 TRINITY_DN6747_c0_g1_i2:22-4413(-)
MASQLYRPAPLPTDIIRLQHDRHLADRRYREEAHAVDRLHFNAQVAEKGLSQKDKVIEDYRRQLKEAEELYSDMKGKTNKLLRQKKALLFKIRNMEEEFEKLQSQYTQLQYEKKDLEFRNDRLKSDRQEHNSKMKEFDEDEVSRLESHIGSLSKMNTDLKEQLFRERRSFLNREDVSSNSRNLERIQVIRDQAISDLRKVEGQLQEKSTELQKAYTVIQGLEEDLKQADEDVAFMESAVDKVQLQITELRSKLTRQQEEHIEAIKKIEEDTSKRISDLREKNRTLMRDIRNEQHGRKLDYETSQKYFQEKETVLKEELIGLQNQVKDLELQVRESERREEHVELAILGKTRKLYHEQQRLKSIIVNLKKKEKKLQRLYLEALDGDVIKTNAQPTEEYYTLLSKYEEQEDELRKLKQLSEKTNRQYNKEKSRLQDQIQRYENLVESSKKSSKQSIEDYEKEVSELQSKVNQLSSIKVGIQEKERILSEKLNSKVKEVKELKDNLETYVQNVNDLSSEKRELGDQIRSLQWELTNLKAESKSEIAQLKKQIGEVNSERGESIHHINRLKIELGRIHSREESSNVSNIQLTTDINRMQNKINNLKKQNDNRSKKAAKTERELRQQLSNLNLEIDQVQIEYKQNLEREKNQRLMEADALKETIAAREKDLRKSERSTELLNNEIVELRKLIETKEQLHITARDEKIALSEELLILKNNYANENQSQAKKIRELERDLQQERELIENMSQNKSESRELIQKFEREKRSLVSESERLETQLKQKTQNISRLEKEINASRSELSKLNSLHSDLSSNHTLVSNELEELKIEHQQKIDVLEKKLIQSKEISSKNLKEERQEFVEAYDALEKELASVKKVLQSKDTEIESLKKEISIGEKRIEEISSQKKETHEMWAALKNRFGQEEFKVNNLTMENSRLLEQVTQLQSEVDSHGEKNLVFVEAERNTLKLKILALSGDNKQLVSEKNELVRSVDKLESKCETLENMLIEKSNKKANEPDTETLTSIISELEEKVQALENTIDANNEESEKKLSQLNKELRTSKKESKKYKRLSLQQSIEEERVVVQEPSTVHLYEQPNYSGEDLAAIVIQSLFRKKLCEHAISKYSRRYQIVNEIYETERVYLEHLVVVNDNIYSPLKILAEQEVPIISEEEADFIFGGLPGILESNLSFLNAVKDRLDHWHIDQLIGDLLLQFVDPIKDSHAPYLRDFNQARVMRQELTDNKKDFSKFLRIARYFKNCNSKTLSDIMIMPVQRAPRYEMLCRDLLKHTYEWHPDYENIAHAQEALHELDLFLNENNRKHEDMLRIQETLLGYEKLDDNPERRLIKEGAFYISFNEKSAHSFNIYVFSDYFVIAKKIKKIKKKNVNKFKVTESISISDLTSYSDKDCIIDGHEDEFLVRISHPEGNFLVVLPTEEVSIEWAALLRRISSDSKRNSFRRRSNKHKSLKIEEIL